MVIPKWLNGKKEYIRVEVTSIEYQTGEKRFPFDLPKKLGAKCPYVRDVTELSEREGATEKRGREKREGERERTKAHAYKWYANKIHLSMVVCGPALVGALDVVGQGNGGSVEPPPPVTCPCYSSPEPFFPVSRFIDRL